MKSFLRTPLSVAQLDITCLRPSEENLSWAWLHLVNSRGRISCSTA